MTTEFSNPTGAWGSPFNRSCPGQELSTGGPRVDAPSSEGVLVLSAVSAAPSVAACRRRGRGSAPGRGRQRALEEKLAQPGGRPLPAAPDAQAVGLRRGGRAEQLVAEILIGPGIVVIAREDGPIFRVELVDAGVPLPGVGDDRRPRLDVRGDEGVQRGTGGICEDRHPAAAVSPGLLQLDCHADQGLLALGPPAAQPRLIPADVGLIHLDRAV